MTDEPRRTSFRALGTACEILCTDAAAEDARALALTHLNAVDAACSRFRPDSELITLTRASRTRPGFIVASPVFRDYLQAALYAARFTDGLVDPTVGGAVRASGYDVDIATVRARSVFSDAEPRFVAGWQRVLVHQGGLVGTPQGCELDLGSSAKAHAADRIAALLADSLPGGFLVNLGGDIAASGTAPGGGWRIAIADAHGAELQVVAISSGGLTTSSTRHRTWAASDGVRHHIVDPRTGRTSSAHWSQVSVCASSALDANAASTASIVLGPDAPRWLSERGFTARLDAAGATRFVAGWPDPAEPEGTLDRHGERTAA